MKSHKCHKLRGIQSYLPDRSIYPLIHLLPLKLGHRFSSLRRNVWTSPALDTSNSSPSGYPRSSHASGATWSCQHVLGLSQGLPLVGQAWNSGLTNLNAEEQLLYFELLPSDQTPHPVPKEGLD